MKLLPAFWVWNLLGLQKALLRNNNNICITVLNINLDLMLV